MLANLSSESEAGADHVTQLGSVAPQNHEIHETSHDAVMWAPQTALEGVEPSL